MATTVTSTIKSSGGDYTSLSAWEAAKQANLVTADQIQQAECYAFADTTLLTISGSTTDATRYMRIYAAAGAEALIPYNTSTAYRLEPATSGTATITVSDEFVRIERIQIQATKTTGTAAHPGAIQFITHAAGSTVLVSGCVIKGNFGAGNADASIGIYIGDSDPTYYIRNNFIINYSQALMVAVHSVDASSATGVIDNNTVANCTIGFSTGGTAITLRNNGYYSNGLGSANGYLGTFNAASNYNASDLAADAPGANSKNSTTPTFVNGAGGDWHLNTADTGWKDSGTDLSGTFTIDFDAATRTGTWDIGADEVTAGGGGASVVPILMSQYRRRVA